MRQDVSYASGSLEPQLILRTHLCYNVLAMTTKVTSDDFAKLKNPYTGEPLAVRMTVVPGRDPMFSCPDTYSTADVYPSKEECIAAWDRKGGVSGFRTNQPIRCAYTGEALALVKTALGWKFAGGFDPHMFYSRDEFLRLATMRDGTPGYVPPKNRTRVTTVPPKATVTETMKRTADARKPTLDEEKVRELEGRLNKIGVRVNGGSVSMSVGRKKRGQ